MKIFFCSRRFVKSFFFLATLLCLSATFLSAQPITGTWDGTLKVQGVSLRLVFHIEQSGAGYKATMDSPDQGAKGIPVASVSFINPVLILAIPAGGIEYEGTLKNDSLVSGTFKQNGMSFPLDLSKAAPKQTVGMNRPQEPHPPFPYPSEDLEFRNEAAGIDLSGTLTLPAGEGVFPAVVLVSGSGPQNRNEELLGHKPFLVLADYLTRQGIAVLRYDDRGTAASGGVYKGATTADLATDAAAAIAYLKTRKEIDKKKIGLIGHSEGGLIAPMVAATDKHIAFMVLLAGPGLPGADILLMQQQLIGKANGASARQLEALKAVNEQAFSIITGTKDDAQMKKELEAFLTKETAQLPESELPPGATRASLVNQQMQSLSDPWMIYFLRSDPRPFLQKVKCPVLALNGSRDLQVPPEEDLAAIKAALEAGGNKQVTVKELPGLNHLFQECVTGSPDEYATIEQTFSPLALQDISTWINSIVK